MKIAEFLDRCVVRIVHSTDVLKPYRWGPSLGLLGVLLIAAPLGLCSHYMKVALESGTRIRKALI